MNLYSQLLPKLHDSLESHKYRTKEIQGLSFLKNAYKGSNAKLTDYEQVYLVFFLKIIFTSPILILKGNIYLILCLLPQTKAKLNI